MSDDAAGLGISEKMRGQIRGLDQASRNAQDGISLIQTAEGAMQTVNDIVIRIRELVVQASNDTNVHEVGNEAQSDRARIQDEINQLLDEIDQIAYRTEFNTRTLLNGDWAAGAERISDGMRAAIAAFMADGGDAPSVTLNTGAVAGADIITALDNNRANLAVQETALQGMRDQLEFVRALQDDINERTSISARNAFADGVANAWSNEVQRLGLDPTQAIDPTVMRNWFVNHVNGHFGTNLDATALGLPAASATELNFQSTAVQGYLDTALTAIQNNMALRGWENADTSGFVTTLVAATVGDADPGVIPTPGAAAITTFAGATGLQERINTLTAATTGIQGQQAAIGTTQASIRAASTALNQAIGGDSTIRQQFNEFDRMRAAFEGEAGRALWFHIGANENQGVRLHIENVSVEALQLSHLRTLTAGNILLGGRVNAGVTGHAGVMIEEGEELGSHETGFLTSLDEALAVVTSQRSILGAMQNRLEFSIQNLDIASENLQAANSRIRDADMAREMMRFTQTNVLQQAAISMLAQANMQPQNILQLLR